MHSYKLHCTEKSTEYRKKPLMETTSCNQLALGLFQILKALFCQDLSKHTPSNSHAKFIALTFSYVFVCAQITSVSHFETYSFLVTGFVFVRLFLVDSCS